MDRERNSLSFKRRAMNKDINQHMLELLEQAKHGAVLYDDLIDYINS